MAPNNEYKSCNVHHQARDIFLLLSFETILSTHIIILKQWFLLIGVSTSDGLNTLLRENRESDVQSQSLAFKSGNEPQRSEDDQPLTSLEDDEDISQGRKLSSDLLGTEKYVKHEENEIGEEENSSYMRYRKTNSQDENAQNDHEPHESITKTTLHNILLQPERKPVPVLDFTSAEKDSSYGDKISGSSWDVGRRTEDRRMQKREIVDQTKENITSSGSADTPDTTSAGSSGNDSNRQLKGQNISTLKQLQVGNSRKREEGPQINGEPEFSGRDPLTIFLRISGSGNDLNSGNGIVVSKHPVTTLEKNSSKVEVSSLEKNESWNEGSALVHSVPVKTHDSPTGPATVKGEDESGSGMSSIDPLLLFQIRKIRMNVLKAERQATKELNDVRKDFRLKMEDVEEDLRMVRKLTSNVHKKVGLTVNQALVMARQAKSNATNRLNMTQSKL